jgi:2-keto-4-pentenoate hydratase/2-oxohepta-3-ene-1,7-dioic acid hydratase in catechol pathway
VRREPKTEEGLRPAIAAGIVLLLACGGGSPPGERLEETAPWGAIAAPPSALTFARRVTGAGPELLLVRGVAGDAVEAVVVSGARDPVEALASRSRDALRALVADGPPVTVLLDDLGLPLDLGDRHVAAGTNFREHGDEVGVAEPLLFPKRVAPTAWDSDVPHVARLDYEVELCFAALRPVNDAADLDDAFGLLLCNDFTDRWTIVKGLLGPGEMGTRGFGDGKGQPGFLPVGPFLVVPADLDDFLAGVSLELFVNGELRQRAPVTDMIWPLPELVERALADEGRRYRFAGDEVPLLDGDAVPPRALVLSGTPGGVIFRLGNLWRGGAYLQPDDVVVSRATGLGALRNRVAREAH